VRPAAGAVVFSASAKVLSDVHPQQAMCAGIQIARGVHAVKAAAVRPAVTATTAGAGNIPVSILEDVISTGLSILSVVIPVLIAMLVILFTSWVIWMLWRRANQMRMAS